RVGVTANLLPAKDLDPGRLYQPDWPGFAFAVTHQSREHPVAVARALEVSLPDPLPAFLSVTLPAPPPEFPLDSVVHRPEDATAHGKTVVHGPALNLLIQTPDHVADRHAPCGVDGFLDLGQKRLDAAFRRLDEDLAAAVAPDRLAQKVEAVFN